jgi:hypothetical protein
MSGLSGKPGIIGAVTYVRYVPKADIAGSTLIVNGEVPAPVGASLNLS